MKVFIDGLGPVLQHVLLTLYKKFNIGKNNLLVNTYHRQDCLSALSWMQQNNIDFFIRSYKQTETLNLVTNFEPDIIISANGLRILPNAVLDLVHKNKQFNMHPSLLPDYKGRMIAPWVIINGETKHGITYHSMTDTIDVGDILYQESFDVPENITAYTLHQLFAKKFIDSFELFFSKLILMSSTIRPMPPGGRYFSASLPFNGIIDPNWDAKTIEKFIRAMNYPNKKGAILRTGHCDIECKTYADFEHAWTKHNIMVKN